MQSLSLSALSLDALISPLFSHQVTVATVIRVRVDGALSLIISSDI
jgi:hypothetical protein